MEQNGFQWKLVSQLYLSSLIENDMAKSLLLLSQSRSSNCIKRPFGRVLIRNSWHKDYENGNSRHGLENLRGRRKETVTSITKLNGTNKSRQPYF